MRVADAVGRTLVAGGVSHAFGVVGSGNFHVTNAMVAMGARFVAARHEGGAATMADAFSRMSDSVASVTLHQGCGMTNALTGIAEAAKSRTPLLIVAAEATNRNSNFRVDQDALASAVGARSMRITSGASAVAATISALELASRARCTVVLNLPLDVQEQEVDDGSVPATLEIAQATSQAANEADLDTLITAIRGARQPVFIAGRGARHARTSLERLGDASGALLATSAVAKGLFNGNPWSLDVSGGFASPLAAELISNADLIVGWGCSLNMWTTRHGRLIDPNATVIQVDDHRGAIAQQRPGAIGVVGDVEETARAALEHLGERQVGFRSESVRARIAGQVRWADVPYSDDGSSERIDPRTLTITLDRLLPQERIVSVDSGNFMGYPSMYLSVPDQWGFCFTQSFQAIGLGLATAIGAALAQPDRTPVAALGDGGALMGVSELETVVRLGLPMVVVVYNDAGYGAEVHHFGPHGYDLGQVMFPDTDIAALARGIGFEALTVRSRKDLAPVVNWVHDQSKPLLVDAKVTSGPSWWLEEAFRGH